MGKVTEKICKIVIDRAKNQSNEIEFSYKDEEYVIDLTNENKLICRCNDKIICELNGYDEILNCLVINGENFVDIIPNLDWICSV